jgi:hypothetical protein
MFNLPGAISLERDEAGARILNASDLELRDAMLIDIRDPAAGLAGRSETPLGSIAPGTIRPVAAGGDAGPKVEKALGFDPTPLLNEFRAYGEDRPENRGEIRLVAWSPRPVSGLKLDPTVDRHRGFTLLVVHLRTGPPPAPDGPLFNALARTEPDRP